MLKVATKWVSIGILLGIPYDRIQFFETEDDLEKRVSKLVDAWLDKKLGSEPPTWKTLVEVIAAKAGGDHQALAKQLASEHPATEGQGRLYSLFCRYLITRHTDEGSSLVSGIQQRTLLHGSLPAGKYKKQHSDINQHIFYLQMFSLKKTFRF